MRYTARSWGNAREFEFAEKIVVLHPCTFILVDPNKNTWLVVGVDGGIVERLRVDQVRFQEAKYELYGGAVVELRRPAIILQWWRTPVAEDVCETVVVKDVGAFL